MNHIIDSLTHLPLFAPLKPGLRKFARAEFLPTPIQLTQQLAVDGIKFVPQGAKSGDFIDGYEQRIFLKGEVKTRANNWHDFFNALVWHQFPKAKKAINHWQYQLQESRHPAKTRLPAENMLTLFDENGCVVLARNPLLLDLIRQHRWHELFWQRRGSLHEDLTVIIFGHGLYEKALNPFIGLTAKCLLFEQPASPSIDTLIEDFIRQKGESLRTEDLCPLPILGMPGWWDENNNEQFYANQKYFRP